MPGLPRSRRLRRARVAALVLALACAAWPAPSSAHDASAYGGLFRTRDGGATWFMVNDGRIVSGALALAVSPTDVNHLLLATDSGLLRSRNGGRDWDLEAPDRLVGVVFAVAFDADGRRALAATGSALFRAADGLDWRKGRLPEGAAPARALVPGVAAGRVYLAGWAGLYRSEDFGGGWTDIGKGLPEAPVTALLVAPGPTETLYAVASGRLFSSGDGGATWRPRDVGLPAGAVGPLALDPASPTGLWATGADQVYRTEDRGESWRPVGRPLRDPNALLRGLAIAGAGPTIVISADRGILRSADGGTTWELVSSNLPVHLEAWPLVQDRADRVTVYSGFGLTPYGDLWRLAAEQARAGRWNLFGARSGLFLLASVAAALYGLAAVSWARRRRDAARLPAAEPYARVEDTPR